MPKNGSTTVPRQVKRLFVGIYVASILILLAIDLIYLATGNASLLWFFINLLIWVSVITAIMLATYIIMSKNIFEKSEVERERLLGLVRDSQTLQQTLMDASPDAIVVSDLEGRVITASDRAVRDLYGGEGLEDLVGESSFDFVAPEDMERAAVNMAITLERGATRDIEYTLLKKDGTRYSAELSAAVLKDDEGRPTGFVGIVRDITERKRAEEEARKEKERWEQTFSGVSEGMFITDTDYNILQANEAFADIVGMAVDDVVGRKCFELLHDSHSPLDNCLTSTAIDERRSARAEIYANHLKKYLNMAAYPLFDEEGNLDSTVHVLRDITERKLMEEALRESEETYRILVEASPDSIISFDQEFVIRSWSPSAQRMFGYPEDEVIGQSLALILPDDIIEPGMPVLRSLVERGIVSGAQKILRRKNGDVLPVELNINLMEMPRGDGKLYVATCRDITERKETEAILEEMREREKILINTTDESIILLDLEGTVLAVNVPAALRLNTTTDNLIGSQIWEFWPLDISEHRREIIREVARSGKEAIIEDEREGIYFESVITPVFSNGGSVERIAIYATDVTERRQAEEELRESERKYRELSESLEEQVKKRTEEIQKINVELDGYAHTVSHDLRGPLSNILGASYSLQELLKDPQVQDFRADLLELVDIAGRGARRAENLVSSLLSLAEAGQVPKTVTTVDVSVVTATVLDENAGIIDEQGITVRVDDNLGEVTADSTHVYQIFSNVIRNAIRYNDSDIPAIEITYLGGSGGGAHRYLVRDNGSGIPTDVLDKVFEPFFKGEKGSTGVGLTTVRKIIEIYGGEIRAYNDNGACFEFTLGDYPPEGAEEVS